MKSKCTTEKEINNKIPKTFQRLWLWRNYNYYNTGLLPLHYLSTKLYM
jgi:hypothetical protein